MATCDTCGGHGMLRARDMCRPWATLPAGVNYIQPRTVYRHVDPKVCNRILKERKAELDKREALL